ncbi:hypothetical protein BDN72DRAFT_895628 [Pluteus cervinus]|uniref:Uncharacterized protein n=1 Tax=Pluteus cervinus TaxID=181527 RepID=A0ACD3B1B9_9AGAR|nr:hypothetical protein BDN72DRAFT_895628 [Pluteus cervinus]
MGLTPTFQTRIPKSLAVRCFACPDIGFNVEKRVVDAASEAESHKYSLFLSIDGNFRLQRTHTNKRRDADDVALIDGHGYFVNDSDYTKYLQGVDPSSEVVLLVTQRVHNLCAVRMQNNLKFKNAAITGVICVQCARHGYYMPQGTANLEKGEAYARSDYVLMRVLDENNTQRWIMVSYDIWCQFHINLPNRVAKHFPNQLPILDHVRGAVPKMHVKGHMEECQQRWSFNYLPHSGETCGEKIETSWAEQNQSAGSTKQQNPSHRHDTLDDIFGFWNWNKLITLVAYISKQYQDCTVRLSANEEWLEELTKTLSKSHTAEAIQTWRIEDTTPKYTNGVWTSVYIARSKKGRPPSQLKAYQDLVNQERITAFAGLGQVGDAEFISQGLRIEAEQCRIQAQLVSDDPSESSLLSARLSLQNNLRKWLTTQGRQFPSLRDSLPNVDLTFPENVTLCLPSHWTTVNRPHALAHLVPVEHALRDGQCHDALDSLRTAIKTFNANYRDKQNSIRGQHPNTRAQSFLNTLDKDKSLQPLDKSQLWGRDMGIPAELGASKKPEPWFWVVGRPSGLSPQEEKDWNYEVDKARWFRHQAIVNRGREEKEILDEEIHRVYTSFVQMASTWRLLGSAPDCLPGPAAYAFKQSAMYVALADSAYDVISEVFANVFLRVSRPSG